MTSWVALLRGVNVNGVTIRNADLAALVRETGFEAVATVLASGNVRFDASDDADGRQDLKARIERALRERFDYDAWIVLVTLDELRAAAASFPFDADAADRQPYVVFCSDDAVLETLREAAIALASDDDPAAPGRGVLYWHPPKGRSVDTPLAKTLAASRYRASTTTRNLRTLAKIIAASP